MAAQRAAATESPINRSGSSMSLPALRWRCKVSPVRRARPRLRSATPSRHGSCSWHSHRLPVLVA